MSRLRSPGNGDLAGWTVSVANAGNEYEIIGYTETPLLIEAKNEKEIRLAAYCDQATRDSKGGLWVAIVKRRNYSTGKAYVVTTLDTWLRIMGAQPVEEAEDAAAAG